MNINHTLKNFPDPDVLLDRLTNYSIIDVIMNNGAEFDGSVYHCNTDWNAGVALFTIDDGCGDHFHILFSDQGSVIKGFGHESDLSPYNYEDDDEYPDYRFYENIPHELYELLDDDALERDLLTFCAWRTTDNDEWQAARINVADDWRDGSADFLDYLSEQEDYVAWLAEYYDMDIDKNTIADILGGVAVTEDMVALLNPAADVETAMEGIYAIKRSAVV